jgi:hypothetical protein
MWWLFLKFFSAPSLIWVNPDIGGSLHQPLLAVAYPKYLDEGQPIQSDDVHE